MCHQISAHEGTSVEGLFYQNDIEYLHAVEKRIQCFKSKYILGAIKTLETPIQREENEEIMALYSSGNHVLAAKYAKWSAPVWHSWTPERRKDHLKKFREFTPSMEQTFEKPANA